MITLVKEKDDKAFRDMVASMDRVEFEDMNMGNMDAPWVSLTSFVAKENGEDIGFACIQRINDDIAEMPVYLKPECRKGSVAFLLVKAIEEKAVKLGFRLGLHSIRPWNEKMLALTQACGYKFKAEKHGYKMFFKILEDAWL